MRMIPRVIDDSSPVGEIMLYRKLESAKYEWTVIHSLDLAPSNHNRRTELDFVILIPDVGILCVEVKSHREIGFDGDRWFPETITKSPFRQAQDARYSLRRRLVERLAIFSQVPVVHCCIFPRADFPVSPNLSVHPFEVMDRGQFSSCKTGEALCDALKMMATRLINADQAISPLKTKLSASLVDQFVSFCFPLRTRRPERSAEIRQRAEELEVFLREQQLPVIKLADFNHRVLIEGGAGTGKSLIGIEVAKIKANQGFRVGYLCFNKIIGQWAAKQLEVDQNPLLVGGSVLSVLMALTGICVPEHPRDDFWSDVPLQIQDRLTDPSCLHDARFDYLVIDEAQDILGRPDLLDCIRLLLDGDLSNGRFLMLGDFRNQVLTGAKELEAHLAVIRSYAARWLLTENCRNYKAIGHIAMALSKAAPNTYSGYMRQGGGLHLWNMELYHDTSDQAQKVTACIEAALANGFREDDITVLSFGAEQFSVLSLLRKKCHRPFVAAGVLNAKGIRYSTVHAYKGMENKVIIITDVMPSDQSFDRNRFYTGITRAQERLHILCHNDGAPILAGWIKTAGNDNE